MLRTTSASTRIALFELALQDQQVRVRHQRHYQLVPAKEITAEDLAGYNLTPPVGPIA